jgi:tryptophan synthase alpha chain
MVARSPRLADAFARARAERRVALIAYVVAGDPDLATTERVVAALSEAGVDCIELGIPYGDPIADGPTIARAAQRALAAGTSMRDAFALVTRATRSGCAPIVYFTYANPVDRFGVERFADAAAASGAAGALVPDVPLEETTALSAALNERGLALPLLVAPTTPADRAQQICAASSGFVYAVSRVGVTGAKRRPNMAATAERVAALRAATALPIAVGFGIATADDVRAVAAFADGAIVGSALLDAIGGAAGETAARRAADFVRSLGD